MIRASAPTRIDLAGGTLDIWPVCHLLERPAVTVNAAIDLRAEAHVAPRSDGWVEIASLDGEETVRMPADAIRHGRLGLATRLVEWHGAGDGLTVRLRSRVPRGSGLGGSSALAVALGGALARLRGVPFSLDVVRTMETRLLQVPTGYQDYEAAVRGGVRAYEATPAGVSSEILPCAGLLARHLRLADTGIEHKSGMNNWEVVRRFLDGDADVRRLMNAINDAAWRVRDALRAEDLAAAAAAMNDEWAARRRLAPVVTNERIDAMIEAAREGGALAAKACGAGGGGCLAILGGDHPSIAFRLDPEGLSVEEVA
jgi:D-glycero-alpha-D-manno-heptose-7-phosphate kinase